tara:strand:+ start:330 stop:521 length:192 start_codon:yes stop_codon:yes gene_type:complete
MGTFGNLADINQSFSNTNRAAADCAVAAAISTQLLNKKPDFTMILNSVLACLMSTSAEPLTPS